MSTGVLLEDPSPAPPPDIKTYHSGACNRLHTTGNRWISPSAKLKSHRRGAAAEQVKALSRLQLEVRRVVAAANQSKQQEKLQFSSPPSSVLET